MDPLAIIELLRWGFPGVTKCRHRSIEFLTTQADQSKRDILINYVLKQIYGRFFPISHQSLTIINGLISTWVFKISNTNCCHFKFVISDVFKIY